MKYLGTFTDKHAVINEIEAAVLVTVFFPGYGTYQITGVQHHY